MGETDGTKQGTPQSTAGQSSGGTQGSTSQQQATKTYTESDVEKMVSDRLTLVGRTATALEQREAALKKQQDEVAQWQSQRDEEQRRKDEAEMEQARDKPEIFSQIQRDRKVREREKAVTEREKAVEQKALADKVRVESAEEVQKEIDIWDITQEYEGADPMKLKNLCDTFKTTSKEQIRQAADSLWTKKATDTKTTTPKTKADSGLTIGGGTNFDDLTPREKIEKGLEKAKEKLGR